MNDYYNNLLNQYQAKLNHQLVPQKTPQQISDEQQAQAYNVWLGTDEGKTALAEVQNKFSAWYNIKHPDPNKEVSELKEMVAAMSKQLEALNNQLK
jgi:phosphomevalonate kinase